MIDNGSAYSAINSGKCTIAHTYCTFHLINMRAVFNLRHPKLKLSSAWDINMPWKCLFLFFLKKTE